MSPDFDLSSGLEGHESRPWAGLHAGPAEKNKKEEKCPWPSPDLGVAWSRWPGGAARARAVRSLIGPNSSAEMDPDPWPPGQRRRGPVARGRPGALGDAGCSAPHRAVFTQVSAWSRLRSSGRRRVRPRDFRSEPRLYFCFCGDYLFTWERKRARAPAGGGPRERQNPAGQGGRAEPNRGLHPGTPRPRPELKADAAPKEPPGAPSARI